ncbi:unnamed protein product [Blepharisma stoltei]|uniref:FCH domain-containing protein n=1 Tax=Blepharisma stoltei TaxID=1481888 RepID=A0AAU9IYN4_9CILI|nr:unnamed protein product [Blepharisma stoltei]
MNYTELWDKFSEIRLQWKSSRNLLEECTNFMQEKSELDKSYAKGLERLAQSSIFDNSQQSNLCLYLSLIQTYINQQALILNNISAEFSNGFSASIKKLLVHQDFLIREKSEMGKNLVEEREKLIKNHLRAKEKYLGASKDSEKGHKRKESKQEEDYQKAYLCAIEELNNFNRPFEEEMNKILMFYQKQEEERKSLIKETLIKITEIEGSYLKSLFFEVESITKEIKKYNPQTEIELFITNLRTGKRVENVQFFSSQSSYNERHSLELKIANQIEIMRKIIDKCWKGKHLTSHEKSKFSIMISDPEGKKSWVSVLNEKRNHGQFVLPGETFYQLGTLMYEVLSKLTIEDFICASQCIILSQTFYKEENKTKIFLQTLIIAHPYWNQENFWEKMLEDSLENEMEKFAEYCIGEGEIHEDLPTRLREVVVAQLSSYIAIMESFQISESIVSQIINGFVKKYHLPEDAIAILVSYCSAIK